MRGDFLTFDIGSRDLLVFVVYPVEQKNSGEWGDQTEGNRGHTTRVKLPRHQNDMLDFDGVRRLVFVADSDPLLVSHGGVGG
jgi:hypothetical protein